MVCFPEPLPTLPCCCRSPDESSLLVLRFHPIRNRLFCIPGMPFGRPCSGIIWHYRGLSATARYHNHTCPSALSHGCSFHCFLLSFPRVSGFSLFIPKLLPRPLVVRLQLARGNAVCEHTNRSDSGRASASMNAVSRKCSIPSTAADGVTATYLVATVAKFHLTYSIRTPVAVPSML